MIRQYSNKRRYEKGQSLVEYALILVFGAMVVVFLLSEAGQSISSVYCSIVNSFGNSCDLNGEGNGDDDGEGEEEPEEDDVVGIVTADYFPSLQSLHLDATSDGGWDPGVQLTASPGGIMERRNEHYHLHYNLSGCPCTITITSSGGGSTTTTVGGP